MDEDNNMHENPTSKLDNNSSEEVTEIHESKPESQNDSSTINDPTNDEPMDSPDSENNKEPVVRDVINDSQMIEEEKDSTSIEPSIEEPEQEKLTRFPMGRIKRIMKMDPDVRVVTPEASFLVSKSLELFVESLVWEAHRYTEQSRKKTMQKHDVDRAIDGVDALAFLEGALDE